MGCGALPVRLNARADAAQEYQKGNKNIVIDQTDIKQVVYLFKLAWCSGAGGPDWRRCHDSTVQIKGKVNSITVDGCTKTARASPQLRRPASRCSSGVRELPGLAGVCQLQRRAGADPGQGADHLHRQDGRHPGGAAPHMGPRHATQVYLSKESLDAQIISAKSSEMNVLVPPAKEGADFVRGCGPRGRPDARRPSSRCPSSTRPCGTARSSSPPSTRLPGEPRPCLYLHPPTRAAAGQHMRRRHNLRAVASRVARGAA